MQHKHVTTNRHTYITAHIWYSTDTHTLQHTCGAAQTYNTCYKTNISKVHIVTKTHTHTDIHHRNTEHTKVCPKNCTECHQLSYVNVIHHMVCHLVYRVNKICHIWTEQGKVIWLFISTYNAVCFVQNSYILPLWKYSTQNSSSLVVLSDAEGLGVVCMNCETTFTTP